MANRALAWRSFGRQLTDREAIRQALLQFVGRAGEKLRRQNLQANRLTVFLMTSPFAKDRPFYSNSMTREAAVPDRLHAGSYRGSPLNPGEDLPARPRLPEMRRHADRSGSASREAHDLFDDPDRHRESRLMKALDAINSGYGARTIHFGNLGGPQPQWAMRAAFRSPRYTTRCEEIPLVH